MSPRRLASFLLGGLLLALLLSILPAELRAMSTFFLLTVASAVFLLVAVALFLLPARVLLARVFALPLRADGPRFGLPREDEMRATLSPLTVAGVCTGVALLGETLARL